MWLKELMTLLKIFMNSDLLLFFITYQMSKQILDKIIKPEYKTAIF